MTQFEDVRALLDYAAGTRVPLWDIPNAMRLVRATLDRDYPWLAQHKLDPNAKPDSYPKFARNIIAIHGGDTMLVSRLAPRAFKATRGY